MKQFNTILNGYEAKGVVSGIGHDLAGWKMSLYKDGKKVAIVQDDGYGGCIDFHWADKTKANSWTSKFKIEFDKFIKAEKKERKKKFVPKTDLEKEFGFMWSEETFVCELVDLAEKVKDFKKLCRKGICYQVGEDKGTDKMKKTEIRKQNRTEKGTEPEPETINFFFNTGDKTMKKSESKFHAWLGKHYPKQDIIILNKVLGVN